VSGDQTYDASALRAEIARVAQAASLVDRSFEVLAIVQSVAAPLGIHPVVVGGMAVYFWTASDEFLTYDIDVVMEVPDELSKRLAELGFQRAAGGRHWTLEGTDIFLEAPSSQLDADAVVSEIKLQSGRTATVISRVDVLIDRLDEFQATGHETPARQALALLAGLSEEEVHDVDRRAPNRRVSIILKAIRRLADDLRAGRTPPDSAELHEIARTAMRTEYPRNTA
jgi:hypothetical protein